MNTFLFATALLPVFAWFWLPIWLGGFLVVELTALYLRKYIPDTNNDGGTLSELVWWLIRGKQWYHRLAYVTLLAFFIDLGCHFFIGTPLV